MAFDSTAELLFSIGAETDDAEGNIERFRQLLGTDLDDMGAQFDDWSNKVLGDLNTVSGAMTEGVAVIGAAVVAAAAFAVEAANKYVEYAEEVEKGTLRTGIAAEDMSKLMYAAKTMGVSYDELIGGLTKFSSYIVKSASDTSYASSAFAKLGISQAAVQAGEKDALPLLELVQDHMSKLASQVDRVAIARELMARGGPALVQMLQLDADTMKKLTDRAQELGKVLTEQNLVAMKQAKIAASELGAAWEALATHISQKMLPLMTLWKSTLTGLADALRGESKSGITFLLDWVKGMEQAQQRSLDLAKATTQHGDKPLLPVPDKAVVQQATVDFSALSNMMEQLRMKVASFGDDEHKAVAEIQHLEIEAAKATGKFNELVQSGKLSAETVKTESAALAAIPAQILAIQNAYQQQFDQKRQEEAEKLKAAADKHAQDILAAADSLREKLNAQREKGWAEEQAAFELEMVKLKDQLTKKGTLTAENEALLEQIVKQGLDKRQKAQQDAWGKELLALQSSLASMVMANLSAEDKITFQYQQELVKFSEVEENKKLKLAASEAERLAITQTYDLIRKQLYDKEQNDLNALWNSQGWQGVLGSQFGSLIKSDQDAWRQWSQSADQAAEMVKLSLVALDQEAQQTFNNFAKGMTQGITQAFVYSQSIGQAMRTAAASTLESLASEALVQAIYSTALGFKCLAEYDTAGASAAFEAAALFGLIGAASAVAGRAIAPPSTSASGSAAAAAAGVSSNQAYAPSNANTSASNTGYVHITINVGGPIIGANGIDELASMINDAVQNRDVRFIATQVKQTTPATR